MTTRKLRHYKNNSVFREAYERKCVNATIAEQHASGRTPAASAARFEEARDRIHAYESRTITDEVFCEYMNQSHPETGVIGWWLLCTDEAQKEIGPGQLRGILDAAGAGWWADIIPVDDIDKSPGCAIIWGGHFLAGEVARKILRLGIALTDLRTGCAISEEDIGTPYDPGQMLRLNMVSGEHESHEDYFKDPKGLEFD